MATLRTVPNISPLKCIRATGWKGPLGPGASRTMSASSLEHVNIYRSERRRDSHRLSWAVSLHFSTNTSSRKWSSAAGGEQLVSDVTQPGPRAIGWTESRDLNHQRAAWGGCGLAGGDELRRDFDMRLVHGLQGRPHAEDRRDFTPSSSEGLINNVSSLNNTTSSSYMSF